MMWPFLRSLSLASSHLGKRGISLFSLAHGRWRSRQDQLAQAARPNVCIYGACAVCQGLLVQIMAAYSSAVYFS